MARIMIRGDRLVIGLSWFERLLAFREDLSVPLERVSEVVAPATAHAAYRVLDWRLLRVRGTALPGVIQAGSFYRIGDGWEFYAVRRPGKSIVIELTGGRYKRLIIQVDGDTPASAARRILAAREPFTADA